MKSNTEIPIESVRELFLLMEEINDLFHQPAYLKDSDRVARFAEVNYPSIKKAYYETLWNLLPKEDQERIRQR